VSTQTQADQTTYQFAYTLDGNGKVTQTDMTDPRGFVRRVTLSPTGYTLSDTRALGQPEARTITYQRQPDTNLVLGGTDALNRTTAYTYDAMGNMVSVTRLAGTPDAVTTTFTYEPTFNRLASVTDPLTHVTSVAYVDRADKSTQVTVTDPLNHETVLTTNTAGQLIAVVDPLQQTTQWQYDVQGNLITMIDPAGGTTTRANDAVGRATLLTDPLGWQTTLAWDDLNQVWAIGDPGGGVTRMSYDPNGNLLGLTDARGNTTSYVYDTMDRRTTRTDALQRSESSAYDANGNPRQVTDRKSQTTNVTYDALDRPLGITYADGSTTAYTWDAGNRLTQIVDSPSGTITRSYDSLDRLTQEVTPQGTVSYTYDAVDRRASMTVAGQTAVTYAYDNANRLTQITQGPATVGFTYDNAGRRSALTLPNGIAVAYAYDAASRLTSLTYTLSSAVLGTLTYTYDAAGNRTSVGGSWGRTGLPQPVASATYDAANQQLTFGGQTFTYDPNGNLTSDGTNTYTWEARDRLVAINGASVAASFSYDGVGRRQGKTVNATATQFLYDGLNPIQELTGTTPVVNFLTGLGIDEYFTRTDATGAGYFLTDALGSTVAWADGTGSVPTTYIYEPFGATTVSGAATGNPFDYTGREDDGTGLKYYRARYYHPRRQRFISEDPIGFEGGTNLYAYTANNPTTFTDVLGLRVDWNRMVLRNPAVVANIQRLNDEIVRQGVADSSFTIRVTGGDRYRDCLGRGKPYFISATTHKPDKDFENDSRHLYENGAIAVDVVVIGVGETSVKSALAQTDFDPIRARWTATYPNRPHIHLELPESAKLSLDEVPPALVGRKDVCR
jgi:RHS repeat-associated protein